MTNTSDDQAARDREEDRDRENTRRYNAEALAARDKRRAYTYRGYVHGDACFRGLTRTEFRASVDAFLADCK